MITEGRKLLDEFPFYQPNQPDIEHDLETYGYDKSVDNGASFFGEGETCGKCSRPLIRKPDMFFWRGKYFHGLVCESCNALFDDPSDSFMEHVITWSQINPTEEDAD